MLNDKTWYVHACLPQTSQPPYGHGTVIASEGSQASTKAGGSLLKK